MTDRPKTTSPARGRGVGRPVAERPLLDYPIRLYREQIDWLRANGGARHLREILTPAMEETR